MPPCVVRWPGTGVPAPRSTTSSLGRGLAADPAGGRRRDRPQGQAGIQGAFNGKDFKVHLDGYDQRELLKNGNGSAQGFFYWTDDGGLAGALRQVEARRTEQRKHGFDVWRDPMVTLRVPKLFDLRADPPSAPITRHGLRSLAHRPHLPAHCRRRPVPSHASRRWSSFRRAVAGVVQALQGVLDKADVAAQGAN